jgi:peptidoglycan/xylan/chitin deacetylase (PgdA/CDA1 family)
MTPEILYRVKTREALVALSFDDGPHGEFTPQVLEILERYGATFFLSGKRAERQPELVARIRAAGHEIGNHYWRDGSVLGHSRARFEEELERTEWAVAASKSGPLRKAGPTTALLNGGGVEGEDT